MKPCIPDTVQDLNQNRSLDRLSVIPNMAYLNLLSLENSCDCTLHERWNYEKVRKLAIKRTREIAKI